MNIVFWGLVIAGLILLWFLLAFAFKSIGKFFFKIWSDAVNEIKEDEEKEESEEK